MTIIIKIIIAISFTIIANYIAFAWVEGEGTIKERLKAIKNGRFTPLMGAFTKFCFCNLITLYSIALFYGYEGISLLFNLLFYGISSVVLLIRILVYFCS